jgi:hypothetical protein
VLRLGRTRDKLPCVSLTCVHRGIVAELPRVVVDTGSAITILDEAELSTQGVVLGPPKGRARMHGIGGSERATSYELELVEIQGEIAMQRFAPHIGPARYGRDIGGLLGLDFLRQAGAIINLADWTIDFVPAVQSAG